MANVCMAVFSQRGSTRTVADRIRSGLESRGNTVTLCMIGEDAIPDLNAFDAFGIGSPTFFFALPFNVVEFIKSLPDLTGKPAFSFMTYGTTPEDAGNRLQGQLRGKGAKELGTFACCGSDHWLGYVKRGYLFSPESPTSEELDEAEEFGRTVAARIDGETFMDEAPGRKPGFVYRIERHLTRPFYVKMYTKLFHAKKSLCDGCGVCVKRCPKHNIELTRGRPKWGTDCTLCMRCELDCPRDAISSAIDMPIFAPFMSYNINHAVKKETPFVTVEHSGGKTSRI